MNNKKIIFLIGILIVVCIAFCSGFFIGQAQNTRKDLVVNPSRRYTL